MVITASCPDLFNLWFPANRKDRVHTGLQFVVQTPTIDPRSVKCVCLLTWLIPSLFAVALDNRIQLLDLEGMIWNAQALLVSQKSKDRVSLNFDGFQRETHYIIDLTNEKALYPQRKLGL